MALLVMILKLKMAKVMESLGNQAVVKGHSLRPVPSPAYVWA